jgi:trans-aconitate methyltransferase
MRFDACAHSYDDHAAPQRAFAARVAEFIQLAPHEEVLEFGAGTGALTRRLCEGGGAGVLATDASPAMVSLGRAAVPAAKWSTLDSFRAAVPRSSLQVSSGLLQWAEDPKQVLEHWKAALKPGGRMVHAVPCEPCLAEWRALVRESPVRWRDQAGWRKLFAQAGLQVRRQQSWVLHPVFPSALELVRSLHQSGVTGRVHLDPGRLRAAIRAYDARHRGPEGVIATWAWLAIEAVPAA